MKQCCKKFWCSRNQFSRI